MIANNEIVKMVHDYKSKIRRTASVNFTALLFLHVKLGHTIFNVFIGFPWLIYNNVLSVTVCIVMKRI